MTTTRGPALLERDQEVAALTAAAADAAAGSARLVVVEGPAGIGKSRLLAALRAEAPALGLRVLAARGGELEREFPFGVVRQLWEPDLADPEVRARWLAGPAAPAAGAVDPLVVAAEGGDATFAVLHGLFWLTATAAAEGPLALVVDDLHWADVPSLRHLAYLVPRLEGLPVLLVAGLRSGEPGAHPGLVGEIARDPSALSLRPAPLSDAAVGILVEERLGAPGEDAFRDACHAATGGNPLLLEHLLRSLGDDRVTPDAASAERVREIGARAIARTVLMRLSRLPPDATAVARAVATLGDGADPPGIAAVAGLDGAQVAAALTALARAEILRPDPPVGFVHPLVRDAVHREVDPATREVLHAAAARHLAAAGAPAERIAAQMLLVSPAGDPDVVRTLREAAAGAGARGAPDTAAVLLRRALREPPADAERAGLLADLEVVETQVDLAAAVTHLREAWDVAGPGELRARLARPFTWALVFAGEPQEGADTALAAAASLPPGEDDLRQWLVAIAAASTNFGARVPAARALPADAEGEGPGARALRSWIAFDHAMRGDEIAAAAALGAAALDGGVLQAQPDGFLMGCGALIAIEMAELPSADAAWDDALTAAHREGSLFAVSSLLLWRGLGLIWRGDLHGARAHLEECIPMLRVWGLASDSHGTGFLAEALAEAGDTAGARAMLPATSGWPSHADGSVFLARAETAVLLAEGRHSDALDAAGRIEAALADRGTRDVMNPRWVPWRSLTARALMGLGRDAEAADLLEAELARARGCGAPGPVGRALRLLGRPDEAVAVLEGSTSRLELARALADQGTARRLARRPTEAREPLRRALELADACGAAGLADHVRAELGAAGARPRTTAIRGVGALTPSERRAAEMAATGMTNRAIAEALYVTPKTIELHLSSAYRKLDVRTRHELPGALAVT
ncbi:MAG: AAA family ATPase [Thermoleophilia bacterium]